MHQGIVQKVLHHGSRGTEKEKGVCPTCAAQFYNSPDHIIRRVDPLRDLKDDCAYCQVRQGYDYLIKKVDKRKRRLQRADENGI